jgi:hypothetical protein
MTAVELAFRYANTPGTMEMRAIDSLRDVYGIRRIRFNESDKTVRVEYDASRLQPETVASLLRTAGLDLNDNLTLA